MQVPITRRSSGLRQLEDSQARYTDMGPGRSAAVAGSNRGSAFWEDAPSMGPSGMPSRQQRQQGAESRHPGYDPVLSWNHDQRQDLPRRMPEGRRMQQPTLQKDPAEQYPMPYADPAAAQRSGLPHDPRPPQTQQGRWEHGQRDAWMPHRAEPMARERYPDAARDLRHRQPDRLHDDRHWGRPDQRADFDDCRPGSSQARRLRQLDEMDPKRPYQSPMRPHATQVSYDEWADSDETQTASFQQAPGYRLPARLPEQHDRYDYMGPTTTVQRNRPSAMGRRPDHMAAQADWPHWPESVQQPQPAWAVSRDHWDENDQYVSSRQHNRLGAMRSDHWPHSAWLS